MQGGDQEALMPGSRRQRGYESPLRAEQVDRTRDKLIEAGIDLVADAGGEELTVRRVAARAGVSVPTAYRYFPDREALLERMADWINRRMAGPGVPERAEDVPGWIRLVYRNFEANDRLMRAQISTPAGRLLRARNQRARLPRLKEMVGRSFPEASAVTQHRLTAMLQIIVNVPAWLSLHDNWGMDGTEAGQLTGWALETLFNEVRRHPGALDFEPSAAVARPVPASTAVPASLLEPPPRRPALKPVRARKKAR
jgi:AcrR family transcriptional regulator